MRVLVIDGDPKQRGFIGQALDLVAEQLRERQVEVDRLRLADAVIHDCQGCFTCLRSGRCPLDNDDMGAIKQRLLSAHGFVVGCPIRNELVTACFKRFYERLTYPIGFSLELEDKYTVAISSVGFWGGRAVSRKYLGLQDVCFSRRSGFAHFRVGLPTSLPVTKVAARLSRLADDLVGDIAARRSRPLTGRLAFSLHRWLMRTFVFSHSPQVWAHIIHCWQARGYL